MNHKKHVAAIVDGMATYMHKNFPPGGATFVGTVFDLSPQSAGARRVFPTDFSFKRFRNTLQKTQLPTLKASCELEVCFRKVCFWCFFFNRKMEGINLYKTTSIFSSPSDFFFLKNFWPGDFLFGFFLVFGKEWKFRSFQLRGLNRVANRAPWGSFSMASRHPWFLSVSPSSGLGVLVGSVVGGATSGHTCFFVWFIEWGVNRRLWTPLNFFGKVGVFLMGAKDDHWI